ncbi:MAG: ArnT family glycosyltransferase [Chloroflexota bacterium]
MNRIHLKSWQMLWAATLAALTLFLALYNLEYFPPTWYDEGVHLLVAKKLALAGKYRFGPAVGPTVFFPVAAAFRIAGVELLSARLVMVGYLLLCVAAFYTLARRFGGWKVATVATLLLLSSPGINLMRWGRQVLGEVPATLFFLLGAWLWIKTLDRPTDASRNGRLVLVGMLLGLAILTKNQFALLLPAWLLLWLANRWYYRLARHADFALPVLVSIFVAMAWYVGQRFILAAGKQLASQNVQEWSDALSRGFFTLSPQRMLDAIQFLTSQDTFYAWLLPAVLYAVALSQRRSKEGLGWALLASVTVTWLGWFLVLSVGWPRYAFLPLVIGALLVARLFHDLTAGFHIPVADLFKMSDGRWDVRLAGKLALLALLLVMILRPLQGRFTEVIGNSDDTPQQMARYIVEHLPPQAEIETYDPEVCFLSGRDCHFPPNNIIDASIKYAWYNGPLPSELYDLREYGASYLLIGDFGRWVHIYDPTIVESDYELMVSIGTYELYRVKQNR